MSTPKPESSNPELAAALVEAANRQTELLALLQQNQPRKKVTMAEVIKRENRQAFVYPVFQNGYEADPQGLSDDTIKKAATVAPGRYLNDMVEIVRTGRDNNQKIFLFYDNSSIDKRMMLRNYFSSFSDLFVRIHAEMKAKGVKPVES